MINKTYVKYENTTLEVLRFRNIHYSGKCALVLHGAGNASLDLYTPFIRKLSEFNYSDVISFSFPGHGNSSGKLKDSSLIDRYNSVVAVIKYFDLHQIDLLAGFSMGGFTAMQVATEGVIKIEKLLLGVPAIYSEKATSIQFGNGFTEIIRENRSWEKSEIWSKIEKYNGKVGILRSPNDQVIPRELLDLLRDSFPNKQDLQEIIIKNAPHAIVSWFVDSESRLEKSCQAISEWNLENLEKLE